MAGEVGLQSDVYLDGAAKPRTLHLKNLRRQWQILALQIIATVALIGMYLEVVSTYVVGSIDHTILFDSIELLISDPVATPSKDTALADLESRLSDLDF